MMGCASMNIWLRAIMIKVKVTGVWKKSLRVVQNIRHTYSGVNYAEKLRFKIKNYSSRLF